MFNFFQSWNIRKKLMGWCLLIALVPMLVMVIANLSFQAKNLRKSIGDRLMDNRQGLEVALKEDAEQFLKQTQRTAAQAILLSAVSIRNWDTLEQLLKSYLRLTQADLYGVYDSEGRPLLVLQKDKTQGTSPSISLNRNGEELSNSIGLNDSDKTSFSENAPIVLSKDEPSIEDDFSFEDVDFEDEEEFSFDNVSLTPSKTFAEKIVRITTDALTRDLIAQLSSEGSAVSRTVRSDGIMRSSYVALEFGGRQIGSLSQGILLDRSFADGLKKRTGLEVALIHPEGHSIVSTLSGLKTLPIDLSDVKEAKVDQRDYLYTFLPFSETKGLKAGGIAILQSLENFHVYQRKFAMISVFFFVLIALAVVLMSSYISNSFSRPIRLLTETSNKIAGGDFTKRVTIDDEDEIGQLAASFNDMTDSLQNSRNALVSTKEYTDNIIKSMLNALIVVSPEGKIQTINVATCTLLGYEKEALISQDVGIIFDQASSASIEFGKTNLVDYLQKKERTLLTNGGKKIPVLFTGSVMHDGEGEIQGIVCLAQDISDLKQAEVELKTFTEQLQRSNRELQDFAHISSHDLQEPLRKVIMLGERLKVKYEHVLEDQGKQYLNRMRIAASRMQSLIDDLLAFSKLNRNTDPFVPVDLSKIVEEAVSDLEVRIGETGGSVKVGALPTITAEPLLMRQLFQNLIGNGLKFCKKDQPPVVKVAGEMTSTNGSGASEHGWIKLTVADNGIGFDDKYTDRIFTVFQRLNNKEEYEGTGIGLATCRKIVEAHGGSITAKSSPGKGAVFIVLLPLHQSQAGEMG